MLVKTSTSSVFVSYKGRIIMLEVIGESRGGGSARGHCPPPPPPPPPLLKNHGACPPPLISGNKKNMKDIINSREFQGDKGPDWPKTFHPRDVPNPSRSYCKICPLPIIQTLKHLVTKKWKKRFPN